MAFCLVVTHRYRIVAARFIYTVFIFIYSAVPELLGVLKIIKHILFAVVWINAGEIVPKRAVIISAAIGDNGIDHLVLFSQIDWYGIIVPVDGPAIILMHRFVSLTVDDSISFQLKGVCCYAFGQIFVRGIQNIFINEVIHPLDPLAHEGNILIIIRL